VTEAWSADGSGLSRLRRSNCAGTSSAPITVHGSSMGIVRHTAKGRAGHTGCEGTHWQSETSVRCVSGHAGDSSLRLIMTVGDRVGSLSQAWSVDVASLSVSRRSNRAGSGLTSVTVHGAGLGLVQHTVAGRAGHTGMRGHRMGVGDVGEVSCELWGVWYPSSSDDSRITRGKQEPGLVCRQGCYQPDEQLQSRRDRRGVCDRARLGLVFDRTHEQGPLVLDGMPGHRLGVRDIGEMPSRSRSSGHTTAGHDGRPGQRQCESGMVC
jgi:hypothetical protein